MKKALSLSWILRRCNIECAATTSAEDALDLLQGDTHYDACFIDYTLGGMNGLDLIKNIRLNNQKIALIMISGTAENLSHKDLKQAGVDGYFNKPFEADSLINALKEIVTNKRDGVKNTQLMTRHNSTNALKEDPNSDKKTYLQYTDKKVLAVDDMRLNMLVITKVLKKFGLIIETAENGAQALERVKNDVFDIVFMDCQMPEMDGFQATTEIRAFEESVQRTPVPIVALTADAMIGDREKCLNAGMDDYINKPFKETEIAEMLQRWIDNKDDQS